MSDIKNNKSTASSPKKDVNSKKTKSSSRVETTTMKSAKGASKKESVTVRKAKTGKSSINKVVKKSSNTKVTKNNIEEIPKIIVNDVKENNSNVGIDKKSLVLLLVAGVILLILIISAAYAYYTVQVSNSSATHNVTTTLPKVGSVVLSNPTTNLHIRLNALNMKEIDAGNKLYATDSNEDYESEKTPRIIGKATVNGGEDDTRYSCHFNLNINIIGTMKDYLQTGDAKLIFSGALTGEYDLVGMVTPKRIEFNNLSGTNREENLYLVLEFNNRNTEQNYLTGKNINIVLTSSDFACEQVVS